MTAVNYCNIIKGETEDIEKLEDTMQKPYRIVIKNLFYYLETDDISVQLCQVNLTNSNYIEEIASAAYKELKNKTNE